MTLGGLESPPVVPGNSYEELRLWFHPCCGYGLNDSHYPEALRGRAKKVPSHNTQARQHGVIAAERTCGATVALPPGH